MFQNSIFLQTFIFSEFSIFVSPVKVERSDLDNVKMQQQIRPRKDVLYLYKDLENMHIEFNLMKRYYKTLTIVDHVQNSNLLLHLLS